MSELASLPTVSAPAMLWALHRIAYSGDEQHYASGRLAEQGQPRAVGTMLRFLEVIGADGRLAADVQATRGNVQRFRDLLRQRFKATCVERGWWNEQLEAEFGVARLDDEPLNRLLSTLPPVLRQKTAARRNLLAGLRELHHFLAQGLDRDWVERRLGELQKPRAPHRAEPVPAATADKTAMPGYAARAVTAARPASAIEDIDVLLQRKLGLHPDAVLRVETFPLEYDENEEPSLVVEATFNPPLGTLTRRQLLRLANCIKRMADLVTPSAQ